MRATIGERLDVMHECRENVSALLFTLLAERMPRQITVTDFLPRTSVSLMLIVAAREAVVVPLHHFLVRLTVAALSIRKVRTACHSAGSLRLSRHRAPPRGMKKPPLGLLPLEARLHFSMI